MNGLPTLLILRHGQTEWNRDGRWQGALDSPLTPLGCAQAVAMASIIEQAGARPATHDLWTSSRGRAVATAAHVARATGLAARTDARLAEIGVGAWAGLVLTEIDARCPPGAGAGVLDRYARAPGGEGFAALRQRTHAFLADLRRPAVVVTHGITSRVLRAVALTWGDPLSLDMLLTLAASLPDGQGAVHRVAGACHTTLPPCDPLAPGAGRR